MDLSNKVALIAGGTRMGSVIAQALSSKGCSVILTWRHSRTAVEGTVSEMKSQGLNAVAMQCDLSNITSVERLVRDVGRRFGRLDVVVNLASIYERTKPKMREASESWDAHLAANARSAYALSLSVGPLMKRSGAGRIIHISDWTSASGRPRYKDYSAYYVSKVAVKGVVEALALQMAPTVLVNAIAPGPILPPPDMSAKERKAVSQSTPLQRWGGPEEIAKTVIFLAETDFVTGETIRVDGGRHLY